MTPATRMPGAGNSRRTRWRAAVPALILAGVLAGCGGGSSSGGSSSGGGSSGHPPAAACSPAGTSLAVTAHSLHFSKSCLAAPAGQAFTVTFTNDDSGVPHNFAIYTDSSAGKSLFKGQIVTGTKTVVYHVPALPAGTYYFRCDVHPTTMHGTFSVK